MANPQIVKGGASVSFDSFNFGTAPGTTDPQSGCWSLWEGSIQVVPDTPRSPSGVTINGITYGGGSPPGGVTANLQATSNSSVPPFVGAYFIISYGGGGVFYHLVDIVAAPANTPPRGLVSSVIY